MNIGERFYCSSCLSPMPDEMICPVCGYNPSSIPDPDALAEGTLLKGMQYQLGAVNGRRKNSIIYGAFDYLRQKVIFVEEYYPADWVTRNAAKEDEVIISKEYEEMFEEGKRKFIGLVKGQGELFEENHTVYLAFCMGIPKVY